MHNRSQVLLDQLREDYPAWQFWKIHKATGGIIWCARPAGKESPVLNADSPESLIGQIAREEA